MANKWMQWYLRARNALDYPLRQVFRWRRGGMHLARRPVEGLFDALAPAERARAEELAGALLRRYHLEAFAADSSPINYRENLFYLHLLEGALEHSGVTLPAAVLAADIGPSHWFYVQAMHALLRWWRAPQGRAVNLWGFEADPYRVYGNLHSRYDHALAHMRGLPGVDYVPHGFTAQPQRFHLITMLFPFVFEQDHLEWGLPTALFQPDMLLQAAWDSLQPGGVLVIVNQGEAEHRAQRERLQAHGFPVAAAYRQDPLLFSYDLDRFVLVVRHEC